MSARFANIRPLILSTGVFGAIFAGSITQAACVTTKAENAPSETVAQDSPVRVERTIQVKVEDDNVQVMMNGKPLPAKQIREIDGAIVIMAQDGTELERIDLAGMQAGTDSPPVVQRAMVIKQQDDGASEPPRGMLGVMMAKNDRGVLIQRVIPGTPAAEAGLKAGDLILEINGRPTNVEAFSGVVAGTRAGQPLQLRGVRDGQDFKGEIVLGRWNPDLMNEERNQNGDHHDERDIHREWNDNDHDDESGMAMIEAMVERLMMMVNGDDDREVDFDVQVEMNDGPEVRRMKIRRGDMIFHADEGRGEFVVEGEGVHGDRMHDEHGNVFHFRGEDDRGDEHAMEEMMREGRHQIEGWMHEMSEEAGRWAEDADHQMHNFAEMLEGRMHEISEESGRWMENADHRMHDFAEMFDARVEEMANAFEQELHRVLEQQDHGHRETEMKFRERDLQLKEGRMELQQKLAESGRNLRETFQKFAEGHQRLAEQNRMLTERVERLEQALRRMMEDRRNVDGDSDARNRDRDQMEEDSKRAEERKARAADRRRQAEESESEPGRRKASDRPRRSGERGDGPAKGSERDRD